MDPQVALSALVFGLHIAMVNLGITLAGVVPYLKWRAEAKGDFGLLSIARKLMRFYAATYALAGVFGTAWTVFLLSFYPEFIGLAGNLLFTPFGLAILLIALHFLSIALYWYGWDVFSGKTHLIIGVVMAVSALTIPLGFRTVFAFLNTPMGLGFDPNGKPYLDVVAALGNPTLPPIYLKSIFGAYTAGFLLIGGAYAYRYLHSRDPGEWGVFRGVIKGFTMGALATITVQVFLGIWYIASLTGVEYKFNNIFGALGMKVGDGVIHHDYSWLFVLKMVFVAVQVAILIYAYSSLRRDFLNPTQLKLLFPAGVLGLVTIVTGEYLNMFSQLPYFVADINDPMVFGAIPKPLRQVFAEALTVKANPLATGPELVALTAASLAVLLIASMFLIYLLLFGKPKQK